MDEKDNRRGLIIGLILNIVYAVIAVAILGLGIATWLIKEKRVYTVPCIYSLAAALCVLHAVDLIRNMPRGKKNWNGVLITLAGIPIMIAMAALTYICLR